MKRLMVNLKVYLILIVFSIFQGLWISSYSTELFKDIYILKFGWIILSLVLSFELSIIIHELGHLIFGLLSGYRFSSIRYRNMLIKRDEFGKLKFYKLTILGTGGQCLMIPPQKEDAPVFLYNAGGVILNLLFAGVILIFLKLVFVSNFMLASFLLIFLNMHVLMAFINWVSLKGVINDGENHRIIKNNPNTKTSLIELLTYHAKLTEGTPLSILQLERDYRSVGNETTLQRNVLACHAEQKTHQLNFEKALEILNFADMENQGSSMVDARLALSKYACLLMIDKDEAITYQENYQKLVKQGRMISSKMYSGALLNLMESAILENTWDNQEATRYLELIEKDPVPGISKDSKIVFDALYRRFQSSQENDA